MIKKYFFPKIEKEVQQLIDENSTKNLEIISLVVACFETLTLAIFVLTRKSFGSSEWVSIGSVLFCIFTCIIGFFFSKNIQKEDSINHKHVVILNSVYYLLMSFWAMWASQRLYLRGEQMLTVYATEIMLVCFIALKPWVSTVLTVLVYILLYGMLYYIDGAAGIMILNYFVLTLVSIIGLGVRYHSLIRTAEVNIQLRKAKDSEVQDKVNILTAIADIYDKVNLIDFTDNTEMSIRDKQHIKHKIELGTQTHTVMSQKIRQRIMPDQLENFIKFTNIVTVRERLKGKRLLSDDFIDVVDGWIRAQYIPVELDENGIPIRIVFTTRNVDDEKQREERLVRIAMTDELTRLFNRRSYEEDLAEYENNGLDNDFVMLSADVNGLKKVNDTMGHAGGDELLRGAAKCLLLAIGNKGKVYRTGGDEFAAILHTDDPEEVCREIERRSGDWRGEYAKELSISVGYASHADDKSLDIHGLEKKADDNMYLAKARHYEKNGVDRRKTTR